MIVIIGGSGSGKSSYAEELAVLISKENNARKYYLATMKVFDVEGYQKVERHKELRKGKGFITIEQPTAIDEAIWKMETGKKTVLLECISNLVANEMFLEKKPKSKQWVVERVLTGIKRIKEHTTNLIIVSNNIFEDGVIYDDVTINYIEAMGMMNQKLAAMADHVVEVIAGIPIIIKP